MDRLSEYYAGKTVAVTGGLGMIGHQLVTQLLLAGVDRVIVLDNNSRGNTVVRSDRVRYTGTDARDLVGCAFVFNGGRVPSVSAPSTPVDIVFNLAAEVAGVLHNMNNNTAMFTGNARLQSVPVGAAELVGVPVFLQVSSVCVYAPEHNHPCLEENGLAGEPHPANGGYAWAKRVGERVAFLSNIERVVVVRPSNVFGPADYFDERAHVIPALIKKALNDDVIMVHGRPDIIREFIYSSDVALGMMYAAAFGKNREAYNIGCGNDPANVFTIERLVDTILDIVGTDDKRVVFNHAEGGDTVRYSSAAKLKALGWRHTVGIKEGLETVIQWYKSYLKTTNPRH